MTTIEITEHSANGYRYGCRCDVCCDASREAQRAWRARNPGKVQAQRDRWVAERAARRAQRAAADPTVRPAREGQFLAFMPLDFVGDCRGADTNMWFSFEVEDTDAAKAICWTCPARMACIDYALAMREDLHGIWGGMTERERRLERRRRQRRARQALAVA